MKVQVLSTTLVYVFVFLLFGCGARNKMTESWKDPAFTGPVKGRVLAVGVAHNDTTRRLFEDSLVANLKAENVDGVSSYTIDDNGVEPTEAAIRAVVKQSGASFVLVTHVAGSVEKSQYFPAVGATFVNPGYYGGLYSYYPQVYNYVYMPAQIYDTEIVTLETGLYDASNGQLIWIGRSNAVNPEMTKKYYTSLTELFVRDLLKKDLIP
jgi:hypothetical protein